jgi:hypothetical protein
MSYTGNFVPTKVNQGSMDTEYENDMIRGGPHAVKVNLNKLIEFWAPSQNNADTLNQEAINQYVLLIQKRGHIAAPFFDSIDIGVKGLVIRTSEGRHRIKAAEKAGLETIYVLKPAENSMQMVAIADATSALFPE